MTKLTRFINKIACVVSFLTTQQSICRDSFYFLGNASVEALNFTFDVL